jgi:hypothetical protein
MQKPEIEERGSPFATSDLMTWIAMTIVGAAPENRGARVVKVRQNFESAISRFGLRGAEADAWLVQLSGNDGLIFCSSG